MLFYSKDIGIAFRALIRKVQFALSKLARKSFLQFLFNVTTKFRQFLFYIKSSADLECFIVAFLKVLLR